MTTEQIAKVAAELRKRRDAENAPWINDVLSKRQGGFIVAPAPQRVARAARPPITVSPGQAQQALDTGGAGDFNFVGDHVIQGQLRVRSGQRLFANRTATIEFRTANNAFGLLVDKGAADVVIDGFKTFRANCGGVFAEGVNGLAFTNNDIQIGYNGTSYNRLGVRVFGAARLMIDNNRFFDSQTCDRCMDLWDTTDSSVSRNRIQNVNDGGHLDGRNVRFKFNGNVITGVSRMGFEWQDHGAYQTPGLGTDCECADNVCYDFRSVWYDTFGLSVMPQGMTNLRVLRNYIEANFQAGADFDPRFTPKRFGIGLEAGGTNMLLDGNVLVGRSGREQWVCPVVYSMPNTTLKNTRFFGPPATNNGEWWGYSAPEGGLQGSGSLNQAASTGNTTNVGTVPPRPTPPAGPGGTTPPPSGPVVTNIAAQAVYDKVSVGFTVAGAGAIPVSRYRTDGVLDKKLPDLASGSTGFIDTDFTDDQETNTWRFYYLIAGVKSPEVQISKPPVVDPPPVGGRYDVVTTTTVQVRPPAEPVTVTKTTTIPVP